jgi:hypothetical protein
MRSVLQEDQCQIGEETLAGESVLIGYRGNFKAATKMHTFVVAVPRDQVDAEAVRAFTGVAVDLAKQRKGEWRGAQSGVLVMPVLVSERAAPDVAGLMKKPFRLNMGGFAAIAQPVVVDLGTNSVHTFRGTRWWGLAYNGLIRKKLALYAPDPA